MYGGVIGVIAVAAPRHLRAWDPETRKKGRSNTCYGESTT